MNIKDALVLWMSFTPYEIKLLCSNSLNVVALNVSNGLTVTAYYDVRNLQALDSELQSSHQVEVSVHDQIRHIPDATSAFKFGNGQGDRPKIW